MGKEEAQRFSLVRAFSAGGRAQQRESSAIVRRALSLDCTSSMTFPMPSSPSFASSLLLL